MTDFDKLKPCEHATYVHYLIGGPEDGAQLPSRNCFDDLLYRGHTYKRNGDAVPMPGEPTGLNVLWCSDEYAEMVFFRVEMQFAPSEAK